MRKSFALVAAFAASIFSVANVAQADFAKGDSTFTLSGVGSSDKDFNDNVFATSFAVGTFLSDEVEVGLRQTVAYNDGFSGASFAFANYNFQNLSAFDGKLVPFVGLSLGVDYGEDVDSSWTAGPEVGARYFVNETTFVYGSMNYAFDLEDGFDDGAYGYNLGIGFRW